MEVSYRGKNVYSISIGGKIFGALFHEKDFARTHATSQTGNSPVSKLDLTMDRLRLKGQNLGRVFNFNNGHVLAVHFPCYGVKLPNLKLKIQAKRLLGYLPLLLAFGNKLYLKLGT